MEEKLAGILGDVFEISGHKTAVLLNNVSAIFNTGDEIRIDTIHTNITGVEMINYGSANVEKSMTSIALLVELPKLSFVEKIGEEVYLRKKNDT